MRHFLAWFKRIPMLCQLLVGTLLFGALLPQSWGVGLQVSPIQIYMPGGMSASALTLRNQGDRPINAQIRIFLWSQENGEDVLTPTQNVVASPPFAAIDASGEQLVRIIRRSALNHAQGNEQTYRLIVDELPGGDAPTQSGVQIQLRYSIPVFIDTPQTQAPLRFAVMLQKSPQGWELLARNMDNQRIQFSNAHIINSQNIETELSAGLLGYALAGSERKWPLQLPSSFAPIGELRLKVTINGEEMILPLEYHQK